MKPRYAGLAVAVLLAALTLSIIGRRPHAPARGEPEVTIVSADSVRLEIGDSAIAPARMEFPLGHRLVLTLTNHRGTPARVRLAGYESQFPGVTLGPGAHWSGAIVLSRPGEDFAWLVEGEPAARLSVRGSHLVEGHR